MVVTESIREGGPFNYYVLLKVLNDLRTMGEKGLKDLLMTKDRLFIQVIRTLLLN